MMRLRAFKTRLEGDAAGVSSLLLSFSDLPSEEMRVETDREEIPSPLVGIAFCTTAAMRTLPSEGEREYSLSLIVGVAMSGFGL